MNNSKPHKLLYFCLLRFNKINSFIFSCSVLFSFSFQLNKLFFYFKKIVDIDDVKNVQRGKALMKQDNVCFANQKFAKQALLEPKVLPLTAFTQKKLKVLQVFSNLGDLYVWIIGFQKDLSLKSQICSFFCNSFISDLCVLVSVAIEE